MKPSNNGNNVVDDDTENVNGLSRPLGINNNHEDSVADDEWSSNQSHGPLVVSDPSIKDPNPDSDSSNDSRSNEKKVNFQGVPRHSPVSVDTIGLRRSPRIA